MEKKLKFICILLFLCWLHKVLSSISIFSTFSGNLLLLLVLNNILCWFSTEIRDPSALQLNASQLLQNRFITKPNFHSCMSPPQYARLLTLSCFPQIFIYTHISNWLIESLWHHLSAPTSLFVAVSLSCSHPLFLTDFPN